MPFIDARQKFQHHVSHNPLEIILIWCSETVIIIIYY